ncbi:diguanylate cyclase [Proteinivorax hydrogeniformans]|uniref:Stage 0 sporulation protein A homolog n=1 Tax=Proteinivorax hydrogeniformans TaxID=1826727 RepID=A0AAU8HW88_9FIRM
MNLNNFYVTQREQINDMLLTLLEYREKQTADSREKLTNFFADLSEQSCQLELEELHLLADNCQKWLKVDKKSWSEKHYSYSLLLLGVAKLYRKLDELLKKENDHINHEYTKFKYTGNILIVDEDVVTLDTLDTVFNQEGYKVNIASTAEKALEVVEHQVIDIVVADAGVQAPGGLELIDLIKKSSPYTAIILLSKSENLQLKVTALQKGVEDFLVKPIQDLELRARAEQILKKKEHQQMDLNTDSLTGAYTKRYFSSISKDIDKFSLAFLDLDNFKKVNDTYGHLTGDKVLAEFCQLIKKNIRYDDMLFRFGGDEFVLVFPNTSQKDALNILKKLKKVIASNKIKHDDKQVIEVNFSCGISEKQHKNERLEDILDRADKGLYAVKNKSKNGIVIYNNENTNIQEKNAILAINDPIMAKLLSNRLKKLDLTVSYATDGHQTSSLLTEVTPDITIVDINLPSIDHSNLFDKISHKTTKSLILGETNDKQLILEALKMGMDDYIIKPFTLRELEDRIKRIL